MPLYEEKLVCPLSVRFTQEHIRPVFQNGMELESTIREIKTKPGIGDYDVLLDPPFGAIEIIRWHKRDCSGDELPAMHWLTFDNRRLYCLQRAAAALWPKRVGVAVQALYAATHGYDRKDNSMTAGRKVSIGHSPKLLTDRWDWRQSLPATEQAAEGHVAAAHALVAKDETLAGVEQLMDAPAPPSMLELFFQQGGALEQKAKEAPSEARSTADASSPRSSAGVSEPQNFAVAEGLCGKWQGAKEGETFEVRRTAEGLECACAAPSKGKGGPRRVELWYDETSDLLWWGDAGSMYAQGAEIRSQGGRVRWYGASDGSWTPKMTWRWVGDGVEAAPREAKSQRTQRRATRAARAPAL